MPNLDIIRDSGEPASGGVFGPDRMVGPRDSSRANQGGGPVIAGRTSPTPPGMRVRNGRLVKLRSGEFGTLAWSTRTVDTARFSRMRMARHQRRALAAMIAASSALDSSSRSSTSLRSMWSARGRTCTSKSAPMLGAQNKGHPKVALKNALFLELDQRLLNCLRRRAPWKPTFLRSTSRASRVTKPACLSGGLRVSS